MTHLSLPIHQEFSSQREARWEEQPSRSSQASPPLPSTSGSFHEDLDARISRIACFSIPGPQGTRPRVEVGTIKIPEELEKGHALVRIAYSRICNSDRRVLGGTKTSALAEKRTILGHEAVGYVLKSSSKTFALGDFVVIEPHSVELNDDRLKQGIPNLSEAMKHLGIHVDGVFADVIMTSEYCLHKIPDFFHYKTGVGEDIYHRQMVCTEPLACVQHGYKLLWKSPSPLIGPGDIRRILILGAGPMGVIHGLHLQDSKAFSECKIDIYDIDEKRREVVAKNVPFKDNVRVIDELVDEGSYDLVVTATSSWDANMKTAPAQVSEGGTILLFSGIDLREGQERPIFDNIDIELLHRSENAVTIGNTPARSIKKTIHFVGTSGYTKDDFKTSIEELHRDLRGDRRYQTLATGEIKGLKSRKLRDLTGKFEHIDFNTSAIIPCLAAENPVSKTQLKIGINHAFGRNDMNVMEAKSDEPQSEEVVDEHLQKALNSRLRELEDLKSKIQQIAFGKADWEKYCGEVGEEPLLPSDIWEILEGPCPFWDGKQVKDTHMLTLIPKMINGRPFTLNRFHYTSSKDYRRGEEIIWSDYDKVEEKFKDQGVGQSYWILMTKAAPKWPDECRYCTDVAKFIKRSGLRYEPPHALEAVASILMHYRKTGEKLYSTLTLCQEKIDGGYLFVGHFLGGLYVDTNCLHFYDYDKRISDIDVGVVRKL